jgi:hypothetical protein
MMLALSFSGRVQVFSGVCLELGLGSYREESITRKEEHNQHQCIDAQTSMMI